MEKTVAYFREFVDRIKIRFFSFFDYEIRSSLGILLFSLIPLLLINLVSFEGYFITITKLYDFVNDLFYHFLAIPFALKRNFPSCKT